MHQLSKAEKTKKWIISQVAPIFNKKGYGGTALSDIELATGLTKGAIYGNFKNKDNLAHECFSYNLLPLQKGVHQSLTHSEKCIDQLAALLSFYENHFESLVENGGCPLMNTATEADDTLPQLRSRAQSSISNWRNEVQASILKGQHNNEIRAIADASAFATNFIASIQGGILLAKTMQNKKLFVQVLDDLRERIYKELQIK